MGQRASPRIETVTPQQKAMRLFVLVESLGDRFCESGHVLRVFDDRQPLRVFVCIHSLKSLQHLITFDLHAAVRGIKIAKDSFPTCMSMQHCDRASLFYD